VNLSKHKPAAIAKHKRVSTRRATGIVDTIRRRRRPWQHLLSTTDTSIVDRPTSRTAQKAQAPSRRVAPRRPRQASFTRRPVNLVNPVGMETPSHCTPSHIDIDINTVHHPYWHQLLSTTRHPPTIYKTSQPANPERAREIEIGVNSTSTNNQIDTHRSTKILE